ncbi:MAG: TolC family protein [Planctomycetaceae bacterium]|nr:TolC family protein [Planctomycetaceae bacterium]
MAEVFNESRTVVEQHPSGLQVRGQLPPTGSLTGGRQQDSSPQNLASRLLPSNSVTSNAVKPSEVAAVPAGTSLSGVRSNGSGIVAPVPYRQEYRSDAMRVMADVFGEQSTGQFGGSNASPRNIEISSPRQSMAVAGYPVTQDSSALTIPSNGEPAVSAGGVPAGPVPQVPGVPTVPGVPQGVPQFDSRSRSAQQLTVPPSADGAIPLIQSPNGSVRDLQGPHAPSPAPLAGHSMSGHSMSRHSMPGRSVNGTVPGMSGFRATTEADAPRWMSPYHGRVEQSHESTPAELVPTPVVQIPADFIAWWDPNVRNRAGIAPTTIPVDVSRLVNQAMMHSPQILALQTEPEVQQRVVMQEEAAFDWRAFLESKYNDTNDPVGNTLTTGNGDQRFKDFRVSGSGGVKRRTELGGEVELAQQFGHQYNNSNFLVPNGQSTARLELSFRQPLLGRGGTYYAQNQIVQARINANISNDEVVTELQNHLYKVTEAYWQLYRARAEFFQRQKLLNSARDVLATLEARERVDTIARQVLRARAAVSRAEATMQRAVTSIRNGESQLRLLVNDPAMLDAGPVELMPTESPVALEFPVTLRASLQTALINRPDISRAIRQMRASGVRLGVSQNEMLPRLDFIVSSYVAGLAPDEKVENALGSQFSEGRPGFGVGLEFEVPLGNRAARAKMEQRQWELKRSINVFRATVEASLTEVEVANREVETSYREMLGRYQAMVAAQTETAYLEDRFRVLPMAEASAILLLEDLLDSFERLADSESAFVDSQVSYSLAIIQLRRATGVLLISRHDAPQLKPEELNWVSSRIKDASADGPGLTREFPQETVPHRFVPEGQPAGNAAETDIGSPSASTSSESRRSWLPAAWGRTQR